MPDLEIGSVADRPEPSTDEGLINLEGETVVVDLGQAPGSENVQFRSLREAASRARIAAFKEDLAFAASSPLGYRRQVSGFDSEGKAIMGLTFNDGNLVSWVTRDLR